ncbi:hypothetical protein S7711_08421 [Stachybotrys chartarum IBT 7711]|uniref:DUF7580 domain-containing protein n=1 Tax=Stachybotrys chartarum (strain CBS 109288 / IBT 7711) TaxID=1280523 RepID=A0A084BAS5_STACB|nr:hypothetical protein S7711_08421 [Stachybotrys chartarum IBT 7711]
MADPVSIALGVAPLCVGAIKGIKAAKTKLKTLRQHNSELKTLRKKFTKETHIFLDECHLLLQEVVDPDDVVFMIEEADDALWRNPLLDDGIKIYLGRRYDDFMETLEEIKDQICSLDSDLNTEFSRDQLKGPRKSSERMRDAFDVAFHKSKYESRIDSIKELNQDLKRQRKTAKQVQEAKPKSRKMKEHEMPKIYQLLSQYSRSFLEALGHCWSCIRPEHVYHDLALFLHQPGEALSFIIRRRTVAGFKTFTDSTTLSVISEKAPAQVSFGYPTPESSVSSESSCDDAGARKRLKMTSFDEGASTLRANPLASSSTMLSINLSDSQDVCETLDRVENLSKCCIEAPSCYIDTLSNLRHTLRPEIPDHLNTQSLSRESVPLQNLLDRTVDNAISVPQQLRLALALARGLLLFNSSPWWRTYWSLQDIFYFDMVDDLDAGLKTLHINTEIQAQKNCKKGKQIARLAPIEQGFTQEAHLSYGIRNLALYGLGVALLQIDHWRLLDADDVVSIRKLSQQSSRLGPRYQDVVQKCIECDFGHGSDLETIPLQNAVYRMVVCEIESLVGVLERP